MEQVDTVLAIIFMSDRVISDRAFFDYASIVAGARWSLLSRVLCVQQPKMGIGATYPTGHLTLM